LHMTLEADYAVRFVDFLASCKEKTGAHTISEQTQVPLRFTLKILRKLVDGGIVQSYKGARGGYQLSRAPGKITLREVIEAVEGPYVINRCQKDDSPCGYAESCRFHRVYHKISQMVRDELDAYTFALPEEKI